MNILSLLEIPELLSLICNSSDDSTRACLARTCSFFFQTVSPLLWENIAGAHQIFALLPGSIIDTAKPADPPHQELGASGLASIDLARFSIYAPFVKSLQIYQTEDTTRKSTTSYNWAFLESFARHQPLLPNLKHLIVNQRTGAPTQEKWITILATRGLQAVRTPLIPNPLVLPYPVAINLSMSATASATLAVRASEIKELEIYPIATSRNPEAVGPKSSGTSQPSPYRIFYNSLGHLTALRKLSTSAILFEPSVLAMVGNLPHLESLYVHKVTNMSPNFPEEPLPANSFRSLKQLTLIDFHETHLQVVFGWRPLVGNLRSLKVRTSYARHMRKDWVRTVFIPLLRNSSPELADFVCENTNGNHDLGLPFQFGLDDLQ